MTGKDYFILVRNAKESRKALANHISDLREEMTVIGSFDYSKTKVDSSPKNMQEERIIRLSEMIDKYEEEIAKDAKLVLEAETRIKTLSRSQYAQVLRYRYLDDEYRCWEWIGMTMGYAADAARRIHREALTEFEEKYLNN